MSWFRGKPTEAELELVVLQAAMLARANEHDTGRLSTSDEISACVDLAANQANARPDKQQKQLACMSVQALLVESEFLEELMRFRLSQKPSEPLPVEFRERMLAAIQNSVDEFMRDRGG